MTDMRWDEIGRLLLTSIAVMGSPGPATVSLVAAGSAYGIHRSLRYLIGVILGTTAVLVTVATGITAAMLAVPAIGTAAIWGSALYIMWLAYHIATAPPLTHPAADSRVASAVGGAFLGIANPKAWVAIAAVFSSARLTDDAGTDGMSKVALLSGMITAICTAWLMARTWLSRVFRDPRWARVTNVALACTLVVATALAVTH